MSALPALLLALSAFAADSPLVGTWLKDGTPLEDAGLSVSRSSNGYPILKEYSQCN